MKDDEVLAAEWEEFWPRAEVLWTMGEAWTASGLETGAYREASYLRLTGVRDLSGDLVEEGRPKARVAWSETAEEPLVEFAVDEELWVPADFGSIGYSRASLEAREGAVPWTPAHAAALAVDFFTRVFEVRVAARRELAAGRIAGARGVFLATEGLLFAECFAPGLGDEPVARLVSEPEKPVRLVFTFEA